jgi:proteasome lid subunit RPN8/RPN11
VRRAIVRHARAEAPHECCGLLVGSADRVCRVVPAQNVSPTPVTRFEVDPSVHIALRRDLRTSGSSDEIVGVYHSHPKTDAVLSSTDIAEAHYPDWVHVVVSLSGPRARLRAFRIADGSAKPVSLAGQ